MGQYATTIQVDKQADRRYHIEFGGVKSAFYLYVNGSRVGYSQNSMAPAEFDITDYLHSGANQFVAEVIRYSDDTYLEDQDMWQTSGIFRSVTLWTRPQVYIADYRLSPSLNSDRYIHGVGGNDAWGARTLDQYTIPCNEPHSFEFFIYMK